MPLSNEYMAKKDELNQYQKKLTAGNNITIDNNNVISSTDEMVKDVKSPNGDSYVNNHIATIPAMTGATTASNGISGLVPRPRITDRDKFLKGDGTWDEATRVTITPATQSGTKIADYSINATTGSLYAPDSTNVSITPLYNSGTKVFEYEIDNIPGEVYSPKVTEVYDITQDLPYEVIENNINLPDVFPGLEPYEINVRNFSDSMTVDNFFLSLRRYCMSGTYASNPYEGSLILNYIETMNPRSGKINKTLQISYPPKYTFSGSSFIIVDALYATKNIIVLEEGYKIDHNSTGTTIDVKNFAPNTYHELQDYNFHYAINYAKTLVHDTYLETPLGISYDQNTGILTLTHPNMNDDDRCYLLGDIILLSNDEPINYRKIERFVGATSTENGKFGYVPAPVSVQNSFYLRGDGEWTDLSKDMNIYRHDSSGLHLFDYKIGEKEGSAYVDSYSLNIDPKYNLGTRLANYKIGPVEGEIFMPRVTDVYHIKEDPDPEYYKLVKASVEINDSNGRARITSSNKYTSPSKFIVCPKEVILDKGSKDYQSRITVAKDPGPLSDGWIYLNWSVTGGDSGYLVDVYYNITEEYTILNEDRTSSLRAKEIQSGTTFDISQIDPIYFSEYTTDNFMINLKAIETDDKIGDETTHNIDLDYNPETGILEVLIDPPFYCDSNRNLYATIIFFTKSSELEKIDTFLGADSESDGRLGYVPAPKIDDREKFLKGDGTWAATHSGDGTIVEITPSLSSGYKIADYSIDGVTNALYAPYDGSSISVRHYHIYDNILSISYNSETIYVKGSADITIIKDFIRVDFQITDYPDSYHSYTNQTYRFFFNYDGSYHTIYVSWDETGSWDLFGYNSEIMKKGTAFHAGQWGTSDFGYDWVLRRYNENGEAEGVNIGEFYGHPIRGTCFGSLTRPS